jgi:hypothetical protein
MLRCRSLLAVVALVSFPPSPLRAAAIVDPGFGPFEFAGGPGELSGLTRAGGDQYYAVSDAGGVLVALAIDVDPATGAVVDAVAGDEVVLSPGSDLEGLAWDPASGRVLASDEVGPAIRSYDPATGVQLGAVTVPGVFSGARANRSLESLARDPATGALWTANEEALVADGAVSSFTAGTVVRLQRFDAAGAPAGQWAYRADPIPGGPIAGQQTNGVVDLLALPSGELLVLERSLSSLAFGARIYQVDFAGATATDGLASLVADPFVPVGKTLLWQTSLQISNFEGLALGPQLDGGDWSLLLVADDGPPSAQALYPLRLHFVPEPGTAWLVGIGLLALRRRMKTG